jgi:hypothetical protein
VPNCSFNFCDRVIQSLRPLSKSNLVQSGGITGKFHHCSTRKVTPLSAR